MNVEIIDSAFCGGIDVDGGGANDKSGSAQDVRDREREYAGRFVNGSNNVVAGTITTNLLAPQAYVDLVGGGGPGSSQSHSNNFATTNSATVVTNITRSIADSATNWTTQVATNNLPSGYIWTASPVPTFTIDAWNIFATEWCNTNTTTFGTNSMKWITNTVLWNKTNLLQYGVDTINLTDGWQDYARTAGGDLTNHPYLNPGIPYIADFAHSNGMKLRLYTAFYLLTCGLKPATHLTNCYRDIQKMMSWGVDGTQVDACDDTGFFTTDPSYLRAWIRTANQAIFDYHALCAGTGGVVRPFFLQMNPSLNNLSQEYFQPDLFYGINNISFAFGTDYSSSFSNSMKVGRIALRTRNWFGKGHQPEGAQSIYINAIGISTAGAQQDLTNLANAKAITMQHFITGIGDRTGLYPDGGTADGFGKILAQFVTNKLVLNVWRDKEQIPGYLVRSNNLVEVWQRPLGHPMGAAAGYSNAVLLVNDNFGAVASSNIVLNITDFGGYSNQSYMAIEAWRGGITYFTNAVTFSVAKTNSDLYVVSEYRNATTNYTSEFALNLGKDYASPFNVRLKQTADGVGAFYIDGVTLPPEIWELNGGNTKRSINAPGGFVIGFNVTGGDYRAYLWPSGGWSLGRYNGVDPGQDNVTVPFGGVVAQGNISATNGFGYRSNSYPITSWAALGNCGCVTWMSNATLYLICTNSINSNATTNKLGGL